MSFVRSHTFAALLGGLGLLFLAAPAQAQWGNLKGQVIWGGKGLPKAVPINVDKDKEHCLSKGPLVSEEWVVNPQNKGVRWVMVWLVNADDKDVKKPTAIKNIPPALVKPKEDKVVIDQPCCTFEPHAVFVRTGQDLVVKNSAPIAHNVSVIARNNPTINVLVPAGKEQVMKDVVTEVFPPLQVSCTIHGWMKAKVIVLPHPYFAVTDKDGNFEIKDAPAGKFRLILWHEGKGWVEGKTGVPVEIKNKVTTTLKPIELKPDEETASK